MAATKINEILSRGTTAERNAYTPTPSTPASGPPAVCCLWWDSDLEELYVYNFVTPGWDVVSAGGGGVPTSRNINTTAPLTGGGDLSADRTLAISDASTAAKGAVQLATSGEASATKAVTGTDSRLSDSRTPTAHATSHQAGGSDPIKLDNLAAPDDNTDLDVSTSAHGLQPKLPNDATLFMNGVGGYTAPSGVNTSAAIEIVIGNGVDVIASGVQYFYGRIPYNMTITGWELVAKESGSIVLDIWSDTYANFPPTVADTIVGAGTKPSLSGAQKNQFSNLTNWTTSLVQGRRLEINVDSIATITKAILTIYGTRSN